MLYIRPSLPGSGQRPSLLQRIAATAGAVLLLLSAAFIGTVFLVAAFLLIVVVGGVFAVRLWWFRRQIGKAMPGDATPGKFGHWQRADHSSASDGDVIDAEYEDITPGRDPSRKP